MKIISVEPLGIRDEQYLEIQKEFEKSGHSFFMYPDRKEENAELIRRASDADVMVVSNIPVDKEVIQNLNKLKLLSVAFTGVDHIDLHACKQKNITVCNAAGYSTIAVSELTIALIIDVLRKITEHDPKTRQSLTRQGFLGHEMYGKTAGIIGTGAIGSRTARILNYMGANVIAYSRTEKKDLKEAGIKYVSKQQLLKTSDIISLHLPSSNETYHLISAEELDMVKETAVLINTARGPIVDYHALSNALQQKKLAGAGIDVYEKEPPLKPNHPLFSAPNTVLLPHIAYATHEAMKLRAEITRQNILDWLNGNPKNLIHKG